MKKKLSIVLLLMQVILYASCMRDVVLELDSVPPVLVLNATVTPDSEVSAFLSKSWFLLDSVPEYDLPDKDVHIDVYVNGVLRGSMQRADNPADSIECKGQFKLPGCYVQAGDKVRMEAEASGFNPVSAETLIPEKTEIQSIDTVSFIKPGFYDYRNLRIYATLHDNASERNYYRLVAERLIEVHKGDSVMWVSTLCDELFRDKVYGDSIDMQKYSFDYFILTYDDPVFQPDIPSMDYYDGPYCRGIFTDDLFRGKEYAVTCAFTPDYSFVTDSISVTVHYDFHLLSVSEAYYNYLKVIRNFSISLGDASLDGLLEPTATYSNVTDGFGVVTGYQKSTRRITMPVGSSPLSYKW